MKNGPYHAVVGYSFGGTASALALSEISPDLQPNKLFLIAAPSYVSYIFKNTVKEVRSNDSIYLRLCNMVEKKYGEGIDYFDLRGKTMDLNQMEYI
ncbi:MAG: hypothetical protein ACJA08_001368 [Cyclobacteriaceae bacterium]